MKTKNLSLEHKVKSNYVGEMIRYTIRYSKLYNDLFSNQTCEILYRISSRCSLFTSKSDDRSEMAADVKNLS